jgi:hypothetical protein
MEFADVREDDGHCAFDVRRCLGKANPYRAYPLYGFRERNAKDLHEFCEMMGSLSPSEYVTRFAAQLALADEHGAMSRKDTFNLYQRFAGQAGAMLMGR